MGSQTQSREVESFTAFRPDIEGLRAVAVLLVVLFHFHLPPQGGFLGVDLFFAISGYLITGLLVAEYQKNGRIDFKRFYARRARRLIPAALVVFIVTLGLGYFLYGPREMLASAKSAAAAFGYVSNYYFSFLPNDYFSPELSSNLFLHTWSLSVEEQFYLFWPLLVLGGLAALKSPKWLAVLLMGLALASFALCIWLVVERPSLAFYSLPSRAWQFALGGVVRLIPMPGGRGVRSIMAMLGWIGVSILAVSVVRINEMSVFPGWNALAPMSGIVLLLWAGQGQAKFGPGLILNAPLMQWIGKRSYSLYLWHWPVILFAKAWFVVIGPLEIAASLAVCFALAHLSYELVETPLRNFNPLKQRPLTSLSLPALSMIVGVGTSVMVFLGARDLAAQPVFTALKEARTNSSHDFKQDCFVWPQNNAELKRCDFDVAPDAPRVVLAGDSHAFHFVHGVRHAAERLGMNVTLYTKGSCPMSDVTIFNHRLRRENPECDAWREKVLSDIVDLEPQVVIIGQHPQGYIPTHIEGAMRRFTSLSSWSDGLWRTAVRLDAADIPSLFLHDTPLFGYDVMQCLERVKRQGRSTDICDQPRDEVLAAEIFSAERAAVAQIPTAQMVDLTEHFCDADTCPVIANDMPIYVDKSHVSEAHSKALTQMFEDLLLPYATDLSDRVETLATADASGFTTQLAVR